MPVGAGGTKRSMTIAGHTHLINPATFVMMNAHSQVISRYSRFVGGLLNKGEASQYQVTTGKTFVCIGGMYRQNTAAATGSVPIRLLHETTAGGIDNTVGTATTGMLSGTVAATGDLDDCPVGSNYVDQFWTPFSCLGFAPSLTFPKLHMVLTGGIIWVQLYGFEE